MLASMRVWVWPQNPFKKLGIRICAHNHKTMEVKAERSKGFLVSQPASPAHSVSSWQMRDTGGWYLRNDTQSRPLAPIGVNTLAHTCLTSTPTPVCHKCIFLNLHSVYIISKRGSLPPPRRSQTHNYPWPAVYQPIGGWFWWLKLHAYWIRRKDNLISFLFGWNCC